MAGQAVEFRGLDQVLQGYELHTERNDSPYYSIWYGKDPRYFFYENDAEGARQYLERVLSVLQQSGTTGIYTIKFHDTVNSKKKLDSKSPVTGSFSFRLFDSFGPSGQSQMMHPDQRYQGMNALQEINERLARLEAEKEAEAVGGVEDPKMEFIKDIIGTPFVQDLMYGLANSVGIMKHKQSQNYQGMAGVAEPNTEEINDTETTASVDASVKKLMHFDRDFAKHLAMLAHLAETSPFIYKKALKKLKDLYE